MKVIIDHREPAEVKAAFASAPGCEVVTEDLSCGDFKLSESACVERKAANDFVSSILDGRFIAQARLLSDCYPMSFWIVEGSPYDVRSGISRTALTGAISYISAVLGSSFIQVPDLRGTVETVTTMARHIQEGLGYVPNLRPGKPASMAGSAEFVVSGLPGIGGAKARALLARFGSVDAVFRATEEDLAAVKGIGPRKAAEIRAVLGARFS